MDSVECEVFFFGKSGNVGVGFVKIEEGMMGVWWDDLVFVCEEKGFVYI